MHAPRTAASLAWVSIQRPIVRDGKEELRSPQSLCQAIGVPLEMKAGDNVRQHREETLQILVIQEDGLPLLQVVTW